MIGGLLDSPIAVRALKYRRTAADRLLRYISGEMSQGHWYDPI